MVEAERGLVALRLGRVGGRGALGGALGGGATEGMGRVKSPL